MPVTSIRLQEDLNKSLIKLAKQSDRSKNWLINQAIREFVENQELAEQRWLETLPALDSVRSGKSVSSDKVEAWLSTWGSPNERKAPEK